MLTLPNLVSRKKRVEKLCHRLLCDMHACIFNFSCYNKILRCQFAQLLGHQFAYLNSSSEIVVAAQPLAVRTTH